jgi:hypothetical protein
MKARGVEFTREVEDHGYGLVTYFKAPGSITIQLYEPRYSKGASRKKAEATKKKPIKKTAAKKVSKKKTAAKKKAKKK